MLLFYDETWELEIDGGIFRFVKEESTFDNSPMRWFTFCGEKQGCARSAGSHVHGIAYVNKMCLD